MPIARRRAWRWWGKWSALAIAIVIALIWFGSDPAPVISLSVSFPLWALIVPFAAAAACLSWLDRKPKPPSTPCPECGHLATHQSIDQAAAPHYG
jgi:4-amino-4-deoxy-L-arabinose transferase-like glycosyltransferase